MSSLTDDYRNEAVSIVSKGSNGGDGKARYDGETVATYGRIVDKVGLLKTPGGREVLYQRVAYLAPDEQVEVGDRLVFRGKNHEVLDVRRQMDVVGDIDHLKLLIGAL